MAGQLAYMEVDFFLSPPYTAEFDQGQMVYMEVKWFN